ncbi:hypothetical protein ACET3Z_014451 [Daucus carota]
MEQEVVKSKVISLGSVALQNKKEGNPISLVFFPCSVTLRTPLGKASISLDQDYHQHSDQKNRDQIDTAATVMIDL